jgi:hypothetical protein
MQPLDLNLSSRPFRNNTLLWVGHVTAALLLLAFTVWSVTTYRENARRLDQLNTELGTTENEFRQLELRDKRAREAVAKVDIDTLDVQTAKANQVIDWQAFSWTRLFNRMAEVQPNDVKMIAIRPIFRTNRRSGEGGPDPTASVAKGVPVVVEGVGKNDEAFYKMQDALLGNLHFNRVDPERLVRTTSGEYLFKLRFFYEPDVELLAGLDEEEAARLAEVAPDEVDAPDATDAADATEEGASDETADPPAEAEPDVAADGAADGAEGDDGANGEAAGETGGTAEAHAGAEPAGRVGAAPPAHATPDPRDGTAAGAPRRQTRPTRRGLPPRGIKAKEVDDSWTPPNAPPTEPAAATDEEDERDEPNGTDDGKPDAPDGDMP